MIFMYVRFIPRKMLLLVPGVFLALFLLLSMPGATFAQASHMEGFYAQTNLVSDLPNTAPLTDPNLINPWGLSRSATSPWWVSDNNSGFSTLYTGQGNAVPLVVTIPPPAGSPAGTIAAPTGTVFNGTTNFAVTQNGVTAPSLFLFATEDGTISGWNPKVDPTHAILAVDRSNVGLGAVYKGLAIATNADGTFLYAANFRFGTVEMFDGNFKLVRSFTDRELAFVCRVFHQCYAPFGIQTIGNHLFVSFALQNAQKHDDIGGIGHGFVDVFDTNGNFDRRLISRGSLDSPWGMALAPANFGAFSNDLLVGNFRNGHINVFDPRDGEHLGQLESPNDTPIVIDHLWALAFGNGAAAGATNQLFFTAGIDDEAHGLFGFIQSQS
jgi:uncharacterized protein (TIGR03118 family)